MAFWVISKSKNGYKPVYLDGIDDETNRPISSLIKVELLQMNSNWYNPSPHEYTSMGV
jgi:hypothetical protein